MSLRIRYNSPVALTFSIICVIAFVLGAGGNGPIGAFLVLYPDISFSNPLQVVTMITYIFGHANLDHILGNLSFILLLGPIVEEKYGSTNLLIMIILTALITAVLNITFFSSGLLGASGIVFLFIILASITNVQQGEIPLSFILVLILFVGKEIWQSLDSDQVSQFAHIIGGLCGSFFGFIAMGGQKKEVADPLAGTDRWNDVS